MATVVACHPADDVVHDRAGARQILGQPPVEDFAQQTGKGDWIGNVESKSELVSIKSEVGHPARAAGLDKGLDRILQKEALQSAGVPEINREIIG